MAKETISRNEYYQMMGLLSLAKKHEQMAQQLGLAATDIIEPERKDKTRMNDYIADEIYGDNEPNVDSLLTSIGMTVESEASE